MAVPWRYLNTRQAPNSPEFPNSLFFSLLLGNFGSETGSNATAHTTTHSGAGGDFPKAGEMHRVGGVLARSIGLRKMPT